MVSARRRRTQRRRSGYGLAALAVVAVAVIAVVNPASSAPQDNKDGVAAVDGAAQVAIGFPASFQPIEPCRIVDTRNAGAAGQVGRLSANEARIYDVDGVRGALFFLDQGGQGCSIPGTATAAELTFTAVTPSGTGFMRAWPASQGSGAAGATVLNYAAGVAPTNSVAIAIDFALWGVASGELGVRNYSGTTHLVIDVTGYYAP